MQDLLGILKSARRNRATRWLLVGVVLLSGYDLAAIHFATTPAIGDGYFLLPITWALLASVVQIENLRARWVFQVSLQTTAIVFQWLRATNFYVGGRPIGEAFFYHLRPRELPGLAPYTSYLLLSGIILGLHIGYAAWTSPPRLQIGRKLQTGLLTLALAVGSVSPAGRFASICFTTATASGSYEQAVSLLKNEYGVDALAQSEPILPQSGKRQNLLLVFLESMESTYLDEDVYPGLAPESSELARNSVFFSNMQQKPFTGFTMAGMFTSLCGYPFVVGPGEFGNDMMHYFSISHLPCIGGVLHRLGYHQTFLQAADVEFAGVAFFYSQMAYDDVLGKNEMEKSPAFKVTQGQSRWGFHDGDVLQYALAVAEKRHLAGLPFSLTVATIDTHHPGFAAADCPSYEDDTGVLKAVHCLDREIGKFVEAFRSSPLYEDTILVLMGDHLSMRPPIPYEGRRIFSMMIAKSQRPRELDQPASQFDIAPTILDALGVRGVSYPLGSSLLRSRKLSIDYEPDLLRAFRPIISRNRFVRWGQDPIRFHRNPPYLQSGDFKRPISFGNGNTDKWRSGFYDLMELSTDGTIVNESTMSKANVVQRIQAGTRNAWVLTGNLAAMKGLNLGNRDCRFGTAYLHPSWHIGTYKCAKAGSLSLTLDSMREGTDGVHRLAMPFIEE